MDALFQSALRPTNGATGLAQRALYVRAHWLRMPPLLLARHLVVKALRPRQDPH
jgi:hypothetical protein